MVQLLYPTAKVPTIYFIGVTTGESSIMKVFPEWARVLCLQDSVIKGIDFPVRAEVAAYRRAVQHIKSDELSFGALVTTHKIDLLEAASDLFDELDFYAELLGEVSCISKRQGRLIGRAKDPITSGLAMEVFMPPDHWKQTGAEALVLGGGGAATAITAYLLRPEHGENRPSRIVVTDRDPAQLNRTREVHRKLGADIDCAYYHCPDVEDNNRLLNDLRPDSLVINATGLGKDAPGSPISNETQFPQKGIVWDLNYRGELVFLDQARAQRVDRDLEIHDGWVYFIHGWTQVIAEVFQIAIPSEGPEWARISEIAARLR